MFITMLFTTNMNMQAQVTVGSLLPNEDGALLDLKMYDSIPNLKNSNKGILFSKVKLASYNSLEPLYSAASATDKLKATGMIVYNVNTSGIGLPAGLVQWNGEEWIPLSQEPSLADFTMDCSKVKVQGFFNKGKALSTLENTLIFPVNITKEGSYDINAIVLEGNTATGAGFSFSNSGEFHHKGVAYVTLLGQGMPNKATSEIAGAAKNRVEMIINGNNACTTSNLIRVDSIQARFAFDCGTLIPYFDMEKGVPVDPDHNVMLLRIVSMSAGGEYRVETDSVNGVQFKSSGILIGANQTITLYGDGAPIKSGNFTYLLSSNSTIPTQTCTADVFVPYGNKTIYVGSANSGDYDMGAANAALPLMSKNDDLFDYGNYSAAPFHIKKGASITISRSNSTSTTNFNNFTAVFIGQPLIPNQAMADSLVAYVKRGGAAFIAMDNGGKATFRRIIESFSGAGTYPVSLMTDNNDDLTPFTNGNPIVNDYLNLSGKYLGRDKTDNFFFTNVPQDWLVVAGTRAQARVIMHRTYRLLLAGDGGIFSGNSTATVANELPAVVSTVGAPMTKSYAGGVAHNSAFLVSLLMWAIDTSE
jgi:hypothetical protein